MRIGKLHANQAWAVFFGDVLISVDDRAIWPSRKVLVLALLEKGLYVRQSGEIV